MNLVCVGAGGSGMSALVQLFHALDIPNLVCVDSYASAITNSFKKAGIRVFIGHGTYELQPQDLVIYSAATKTSLEVTHAYINAEKDPLSPPPMLYAEFLGELSKYFFTVAISGTHGKSTTTGLCACACAKLFDTMGLGIVGAGVTERAGNNSRYNEHYREDIQAIIMRIISRKAQELQLPWKKLLFVVEADEFNHHFLYLEPDVNVITSLEHDHVDIYPTRASYLVAFQQFCDSTKKVVITFDAIAEELACSQEKLVITPVQSFQFAHLLGGHNNNNASLAYTTIQRLSDHYQKPKDGSVKDILETHKGISRRAELIGKNAHRVPIFSDYGHHPDEIKSTLHAFREKYPDKQISCVFEPHQARRLLSFWDGFKKVFVDVDCFVVPIYSAREELLALKQDVTYVQDNKTLFQDVQTVEDLARLFAGETKSTLIADRNDLPGAIAFISDGIIVCFSAGILDEKIRKIVKVESGKLKVESG